MSIWFVVPMIRNHKSMMHTFADDVIASSSLATATGLAILEKDPNTPGSLGIAISDALEDAASREDTNYALGSVLNHMMLHQSMLGLRQRNKWR